MRADFGDFELSFYISTQMAQRQAMVFHGEDGFIEVHAPFNAGRYDHDHVTLHNRTHDEAIVWRFPGVDQYRLEAEAFAAAAADEEMPLFTLEDSVLNQKVIDAVYLAGEHDGWEKV